MARPVTAARPTRSRIRWGALAAACALALAGCSAGGDDAATDGASPAAASGTSSAGEASASSATASPATPELPGGGTRMFPDRRLVALYGAPGTASLGALGEQGPEQSVERVKKLAEQYQPYSKEKVVPAFEIIATSASSAPGPDGNYSDEAAVSALRPYVEAAEKAGVYVVLDLQPGTADFQQQARQYTELLKKPGVGLGLDPEWKLRQGQLPLEQIGSVDAEEINRTLADLAALTRENDLPQKAVVLHQFTGTMITDREKIDTSHSELSLVLHADGHGTPELKKQTWTELQKGLPAGIRMAWKNFYDEDTPMLTPEQTYAMSPKPWVVTYQ